MLNSFWRDFRLVFAAVNRWSIEKMKIKIKNEERNYQHKTRSFICYQNPIGLPVHRWRQSLSKVIKNELCLIELKTKPMFHMFHIAVLFLFFSDQLKSYCFVRLRLQTDAKCEKRQSIENKYWKQVVTASKIELIE